MNINKIKSSPVYFQENIVKIQKILICTTFLLLLLAPQYANGKSNFVLLNIDTIRPLEIGDTIPEILANTKLDLLKPGHLETIDVTLNDYKEKLIILDFWATWCIPCIKSLNKLDSIQKVFKEEMIVIPSSYENRIKIASFLKQREWEIPSLVEDKLLNKYFPSHSIPHQVWIRDGVVIAIMGPDDQILSNIQRALRGESVDAEMTHKYVDFNKHKPLLVDGNGGDAGSLLYQSIFSKRINARIGGVSKGSNYISIYNASLATLLQEAYKEVIPLAGRRNRILLEVDEKLKWRILGPRNVSDREILRNWAKENNYCYNLHFPKSVSDEIIYDQMRIDLNRFFGVYLGIQTSIEQRTLPCLVLRKAPGVEIKRANRSISLVKLEKERFELKNMKFEEFVIRFQNINWKLDLPIIDFTNYNEKMDLTLEVALDDIDGVSDALERNGFLLERENVLVDVLVISEIRL